MQRDRLCRDCHRAAGPRSPGDAEGPVRPPEDDPLIAEDRDSGQALVEIGQRGLAGTRVTYKEQTFSPLVDPERMDQGATTATQQVDDEQFAQLS